jgi:hypothetical protein
MVPEIAVTWTAASLPAIRVIEAIDARTRCKVTREVRIIAALFASSKEIGAKPVRLASYSP